MSKKLSLKHIDLNLLVVFEILLSERNVSHAAQKFGLSQSAMSNALNRLRYLLDDPILIRTGIRMVPTSKAESLLEPVRNILSQIKYTLASESNFEPAESKRKFVILSTDYCEFVILPKLMPLIKEKAPKISIQIKRIEQGDAAGDIYKRLEEREIDLVILSHATDKRGFHSKQLFEDELVSLSRIGHPLTKNGLNLSNYLKSRHLQINLRDDDSFILVDAALSQMGMARDIAITVPTYTVAPWMVADTDLIVTAPGKIAKSFAEVLPLDIFPCPVHMDGFSINMIWHSRFEDDPSHRWLRNTLSDLKPHY